MKKLKLNQQVTFKGHACIVWGIKPDLTEVVLFNLKTRSYITVQGEELKGIQ
jgi:hypothetical protein